MVARRSSSKLVISRRSVKPPTTSANSARITNVSPAETTASFTPDRQPQARALDRAAGAALGAHVGLSTYPEPRTVCSTRGSPPASSLRRRFDTNTSIVLVSA